MFRKPRLTLLLSRFESRAERHPSQAAAMQPLEARSRVWAPNTFLRIGNLLGHTRALSLLSDYADYLSRAEAEIVATPFDAERLHRTLHDLRSTSGMLGFEALADICA